MSSKYTEEPSSDWWYHQQKSTGSQAGLNRDIETNVVGVTFDGRQAVVATVRAGQRIQLRRDPNNVHDRNAIRVEREDGAQFGFISRGMAAAIAPILDGAGKTTLPATVTSVVGGHRVGASLGVRIQFTLPDAAPAPRTFPDIDDFEPDF